MDTNSIPAFVLSGTVTQDKVGLVMAALYLADASDMKIDPVFNGVTSRPKLPAVPKGGKRPHTKIPTPEADTVPERILAALDGHDKPVNRTWIAVRTGVEKNSLGSSLTHLVKNGNLIRTERGHYQLS